MSNTGKPHVPIMTLKECMEAEQPLSTSLQEIKADTLLGVFLDGDAERILTIFADKKIPWDAFQLVADYVNRPAVQALESQWQGLSAIECYALDFAAKHHAGQVDKSGRNYMAHLFRVAMAVRRVDPHYFMTGILHDVVEDTEVNINDIVREFGEDLAESVESVTRYATHGGRKEDYATYVRRAADHPIGRVVKLADVNDNLRHDRIGLLHPDDQKRLRDKYAIALGILNLPAPPVESLSKSKAQEHDLGLKSDVQRS